MIGSLKGPVIHLQKLGHHRVVITLEVQGVGFEVQVLPQILSTLPPQGEPLHLFTHLQMREDHLILFGFPTVAERDVFRQLISVSGVGPQLAIALLDTLGLQDLLQAIVAGNTRRLSRTPGVGPKTAERLALELRSKLAEWRQQSGLITPPEAGPVAPIQEDVEMTLLALGYTEREIHQALQAVGQSQGLGKTSDGEAWIREAIAWLSRLP